MLSNTCAKLLNLTPNRFTCDVKTEDQFNIRVKYELDKTKQLNIDMFLFWYFNCSHDFGHCSEMILVTLIKTRNLMSVIEPFNFSLEK